jgi:hypothetical protein
MNDKTVMNPDGMRAEYRRSDLGNGVRGKHCTKRDAKSMLPVVAEGTAANGVSIAIVCKKSK